MVRVPIPAANGYFGFSDVAICFFAHTSARRVVLVAGGVSAAIVDLPGGFPQWRRWPSTHDLFRRHGIMRIVAADIYDVDLHTIGSPPIILRLITDEGLYGLGEFPLAYGTGRQAAIGILKDMVEQFVLGADPTLVEKMWHTLFRRTFWGQGGGTIIYGGMSTIDEGPVGYQRQGPGPADL